MGGGNPLEVLRDFLIHKWKITLTDDSLIFEKPESEEKIEFAKTTLTDFHPKSAANSSSAKSYDLYSVYICYQYASLSFGEYITKCKAEKAGRVSTIDKKELIAYLQGKIKTSKHIYSSKTASKKNEQEKDSVVSSTTTVKNEDREKRDKSESHAKEDRKKRKLSDEQQQSSDKKHKKRPSSTNAMSSDGEATKQSEEVDMLGRIFQREILQRTRTSILTSKKKNFEGILKILEKTRLAEHEAIAKAKAASKPVSLLNNGQNKVVSLVKRLRKIKGVPIIVIPAGFSDLITMFNVRDFLENYKYVPSKQKKADGAKKEHSLRIKHVIDDEEITFKIVDNVARFTESDWSKRVVGVIVAGPPWQFKGWKWAFPVETFKEVCGVHIHLLGHQIKDDIKAWNVKISMIHPDKRHLDKVASKEFWGHLTSFLRMKWQAA